MSCTVIDIEKLSNSVRAIKLVASKDKGTSFKVKSLLVKARVFLKCIIEYFLGRTMG